MRVFFFFHGLRAVTVKLGRATTITLTDRALPYHRLLTLQASIQCSNDSDDDCLDWNSLANRVLVGYNWRGRYIHMSARRHGEAENR